MGMRLAIYTHSEQSKIIVYLMGNDSGQSGLQGPVCTISHRHYLYTVIQVLLHCLDSVASLQSWTDLYQQLKKCLMAILCLNIILV